jgi:hypothetical protein
MARLEVRQNDRIIVSFRWRIVWPSLRKAKILVCEARMSAVEGILLALSVVVFVYLGIAMFKPEWF